MGTLVNGIHPGNAIADHSGERFLILHSAKRQRSAAARSAVLCMLL